MNIELRETQTKAKIAHEDRMVFNRSLLGLAERLLPSWRFQIFLPGCGVTPLSKDSLEKFFVGELVNAQLNFLENQKKAGNHFRTIENFINGTPDTNEQKVRRNYLRLLAWRGIKGRFLEALCLMATLSQMSPSGETCDIRLFSQEGPIRVNDQGVHCFVWTQQSLDSIKTGLKAVPDIAITNTQEGVRTSNILSVIECKCRETIGAGDLRGEFGKAYDIGSPSYTLMSYNDVPQAIVDGGRTLGIDVQVFSLHTSEREQFLKGERDVAEDMARKLLSSRRRRMFLTAIEHRASDMKSRSN